MSRSELDDPRWVHHKDHETDHPAFVDQEWRVEDEDGTVHTHTEHNVNRRARTERPPT